MAQKVYFTIENCKLYQDEVEKTTSPFTIYTGTTTLKLTANDGFIFDGTESCKLKRKDGYSETIKPVTQTTKEVIFRLYVNDGFDAYIVATAISDSSNPKYNVTKTLINCTCETQPTYEENTVVSLEIIATDGYYFKEKPVVTMGETSIEVTTTQSNLPTVYNATFTITADVTITASAEVISSQYAINTELSNATCNIASGTMYYKGDVIHIEVTADSGYYFATSPTVSYWSKGTQVTKIMESNDSGDYKQNFYYDLTITNTTTVSANGQVMPEVDKYGIITIYNPTPNQLKEVGNVRYMGNVDLGDYISNLIKVFVKIPKGKTANILLGGYNTGVSSNAVLTDIVETDCGTVEIVGNYNNAMDYENTTIDIYLPFIGFIQLDTEKVMNETISLVYKTNIINGDTIACLYNTTGTLLYTFNSNASFEIPYRLNDVLEPKGRLEINSNYLFGFTPFITVRYNKAYNTANVIANDNRETFIKNETGYIKCSEVFNTVKATATEKEEIEMLLKGGVIV